MQRGSLWAGKVLLLSDLAGEKQSPSQGVTLWSSNQVVLSGDGGLVESVGWFKLCEPPLHPRGEQGRAVSETKQHQDGAGTALQESECALKFSYQLPGISDIDETG